MPLTDDAELRELFVAEVTERAERLVAGARAMVEGSVDEDAAQDLYREGHTIKGTARMMGYVALSDAGRVLEDTWKGVVDAEIRPDPELGMALEELSAALADAIDGDPELGPAELADAVGLVRRVLRSDDPAAAACRVPAGVPGMDPGAGDNHDLGGLLGTLDSTAFGEKVRVDAAGLYRLINGLCSLRVDADALSSRVAELSTEPDGNGTLREQVVQLSSAVAGAQKAILDLQARAVDLAAVPLSEVTNTYPQLVRYLSRRSGKEIRFELVGDENTLDRQVLEALSDNLRQLLVNAIEHGVEPPNERTASGKQPTATLSMRARAMDHRLEVVVTDDGRGVDWAAVRRSALRRGLLPSGEEFDVGALKALLFTRHFSTAMPGELVGDGNGLAELAEAVESLHGSVTMETTPGEGTEVRIVVPTSRALQDALLVVAGGQTWGLPEIAVLDRLPLSDGSATIEWGGAPIPVRSFAAAVGLTEVVPPTRIVVVSSQAGPVGFAVDRDLGSRQVAARELGPLVGGVPHLTGAALLGGGDVAVLVDPSRLAIRELDGAAGPKARVLVVDDSRGARQVVGSALGTAGYTVDLAATAADALTALRRGSFDAIVLDYVLPTMDGATLVGTIREMGVDAPIVMLSGLASPRDRERALSAGADAFFDKDDVRKGALAAAIAALLEERRSS